MKDRIIANSNAHWFSDADFEKIEAALDDLRGLGNRKAWTEVKRRFSIQELFARLTSSANHQWRDALNDIGTDSPERLESTGYRYARDDHVRKAVLQRANGICEFCVKRGFQKVDGSTYLETHHIISHANEGSDRESNVIGLCAEHHREAHYGARREHLEKLMQKRLTRLIPG